MILDAENLFSDDQAVTVTADSTNILDLGVPNRAWGNPLPIQVQVTTDFTDGTSIAIDLETDSAVGFGSLATIWSSGAIVLATLVAGYKFLINYAPTAIERFSRLEYTVVGTMTLGNITAGFVFEDQTARSTFPT